MRSTRGIMANVKAGLFFKFQFNPHVIETDKKAEYEHHTPAGWDHPVVRYTGNGASFIEFELWGDSTDASNNLQVLTVPRPFGVRDVIAVLESFQLPETKPMEFSIQKRRFVAPPDCYFVFGLRWARCKLVDSPVREQLYSALTLNPNRFSAKIKLLVLEDGSIAEYASVQRMLMARYASMNDAALTAGSLGGVI